MRYIKYLIDAPRVTSLRRSVPLLASTMIRPFPGSRGDLRHAGVSSTARGACRVIGLLLPRVCRVRFFQWNFASHLQSGMQAVQAPRTKKGERTSASIEPGFFPRTRKETESPNACTSPLAQSAIRSPLRNSRNCMPPRNGNTSRGSIRKMGLPPVVIKSDSDQSDDGPPS
jgi:hypothetical protein